MYVCVRVFLVLHNEPTEYGTILYVGFPLDCGFLIVWSCAFLVSLLSGKVETNEDDKVITSGWIPLYEVLVIK